MAVDIPNFIDYVSIDLNSNAVLTISDHLEWSGLDRHLYMIQEKINSYLSSVENGDLYIQFPHLKGRKVRIELVARFAPDEQGLLFLKKVSELLTQSGYLFDFRVIEQK